MFQAIIGLAPIMFAAATASVPGHDHNCHEELGHHWTMPAYLGEIYLQTAAIIIIVAGALLARLALRMWRHARGAR